MIEISKLLNRLKKLQTNSKKPKLLNLICWHLKIFFLNLPYELGRMLQI